MVVRRVSLSPALKKGGKRRPSSSSSDDDINKFKKQIQKTKEKVRPTSISTPKSEGSITEEDYDCNVLSAPSSTRESNTSIVIDGCGKIDDATDIRAPRYFDDNSSVGSCSDNVEFADGVLEEENESEGKPHKFVLKDYRYPTNCIICQQLLVGLVKQGYKCKICKFNFHDKCKELSPFCGKLEFVCEPLDHIVSTKTYKQPTYCDECGKLLLGVINQGKMCKICKHNFHSNCIAKIMDKGNSYDSALTSLSSKKSMGGTSVNSTIAASIRQKHSHLFANSNTRLHIIQDLDRTVTIVFDGGATMDDLAKKCMEISGSPGAISKVNGIRLDTSNFLKQRISSILEYDDIICVDTKYYSKTIPSLEILLLKESDTYITTTTTTTTTTKTTTTTTTATMPLEISCEDFENI